MAALERIAILRGIGIKVNGSCAEVSGTDSHGRSFSGRVDKNLIKDNGLIVRIKGENYEAGKSIEHPYRYFIEPLSGQFEENHLGVMVQYENIEIIQGKNQHYKGKSSANNS